MAGPGPEVAIVGSDGTTRLYNVPAPTPALSVFLSNQSVAGAGLAPAVIIAPGGGYSHLSIDKEGTDVAARLLRNDGRARLRAQVPGPRTPRDKSVAVQ